MEELKCDTCRIVYTEEADIKIAKGMKQNWKIMCKQDNIVPRGIAPCPNVTCTGELMLTTS